MRREGARGSFVMRFGQPRSDDFVAGDPTTVVALTGRWWDGPAGSWLAEVDTPTQGNIAAADEQLR